MQSDLTQELIAIFSRLAGGDFSARLERNNTRDMRDVLAFSVNTVAEEMQRVYAERERNTQEIEQAINDLSERFLALASGDFSVRIPRSNNGDPMDVLAFLFNNVAEELGEVFLKARELNERLEDEVASRTRALSAALGQVNAIFDNMADGVVAVDRVARATSVNPAFIKLLLLDPGLSPEDIELPPLLSDLALRSVVTEKTQRVEVVLPGERTGAATASPLHGQGDNVLGAVIILRDITLEKEIDRMKTDFIATVSHELRTPLTSVLGFAQITKNRLEQHIVPHISHSDRKTTRALEQVRGNLDIIVAEGQRLTSLINDVLDISKMESGRMEWRHERVDVEQLVERACAATRALFASGAVALRSEVAPGLPALSGDFNRLVQVLINLISNGAKFTDAGEVCVSAVAANGGVLLRVTDTGQGIDPAHHASIFEKFRQVGDTLTGKPKGTGLGLPICQQIVAAHGGHVSVRSALGHGSTFQVFLPSGEAAVGAVPVGVVPVVLSGVQVMAQPPAILRPPTLPPFLPSAFSPETAPASLDTHGLIMRIKAHINTHLSTHLTANTPERSDILIVDDDDNLRELLRQQLSDRGYTIRTASNGLAAIQSVRAHRPDLLILDVLMPGISGFDVAAILRADPQTRAIPILILSIIQDTQLGYRLGIEKHLTKPIDGPVLAQEIHHLLRQAPQPRCLVALDPDALAASPHLVSQLQAHGYDVLGVCAVADAFVQARALRPDLLIIDAPHSEAEALMALLRPDPALTHLYVVRLVEA